MNLDTLRIYTQWRPEKLAEMGRWLLEMAVTKKQAETGDLWSVDDQGTLRRARR